MIWTIWLLIWILFGSIPITTILVWLKQQKEEKNRKKEYEDGIPEYGYWKNHSQGILQKKTVVWMTIVHIIFSSIACLLFLSFKTVDITMFWVFVSWIFVWVIMDYIILKKAYYNLAIFSKRIIGIFALLLIFLCASGGYLAICSSYNNALYFDQFIDKGDGFPIVNEVPNNFVRLTTKELAESIAKQRMSEFGSNVEIVDMQVTIDEGRLVWVAVIAQKESWQATFNTEGMIVIDANDPDKEPEIIKDQQFAVAGGLSFNPIIGANGNAQAKGYFTIDTSLCYGDTYPVKTPEEKWAMAMTTYRLEINGVHTYTGVYLMDQRGNIIDFYSGEVPNWLIQPFDEQGFLEKGVSDWGSNRKDEGLDFWAGGMLWVAPSNNRIEMTEDTRYIYDPDTQSVVAIAMTHPIRDDGELSLAGAFKATSSGITYYDLSQYNLKSGDTAGDTLLRQINARAGTEYFTEMELLYPLKVGNTIKQVWFVPIYFRNTESDLIGLAGLGLIDAQASNIMAIEYTEGGLTGASLVEKAKDSFIAVSSGISDESPTIQSQTTKGTLVAQLPSYTRSGTTCQWLTVNTQEGNINILVKANADLTDAEMFIVQSLKIGDTISFVVDDQMVVKEISK